MKLPYVYLQFPQFCFSLEMKRKGAEVEIIITGRRGDKLTRLCLTSAELWEGGTLQGGPELALTLV